MFELCAPIALRVPISLILSTTEVYSVVMMPTAPTTSEIMAMLKRKEVIPPVNCSIVLRMAFTVVTPISLPYSFFISSSTASTSSVDEATTNRESYFPVF